MGRLKRFLLFLIPFTIPFFVYWGYMGFIAIKMNEYERLTEDYLYQEKLYAQREVDSITSMPSKGGKFGIHILVRLNDEPDIVYYYVMDSKTDKLRQVYAMKDNSTVEGLHSETR
ncbi:hypothetical protein [Paenibacillus massiliensis]|uniref:hypothetical protein n=1 Tax=Paenibacillus massiliensis TaxID=225917 RepID=UPI00036A942E|nr:hypothetical protein [Paenibacillus massiliensis]